MSDQGTALDHVSINYVTDLKPYIGKKIGIKFKGSQMIYNYVLHHIEIDNHGNPVALVCREISSKADCDEAIHLSDLRSVLILDSSKE